MEFNRHIQDICQSMQWTVCVVSVISKMYNVSMLAIKILKEGMQNTEGKTGVQLQR